MTGALSSRLARTVAVVAGSALLAMGSLGVAPTWAAALAEPASTPASSSTSPSDRQADTGNGTGKIRPGLEKKFAEAETVDFWVHAERATDLSQASGMADWGRRGAFVVEALKKGAAQSQRDVIATLEKNGATYRTFWATDAVYVEDGSRRLAEKLAAVPTVDGLWPSSTYAPVEPVASTAAEASATALAWGVANIKADQVWADGHTGRGLVIANIDSGVQYDHPALVNQYRGRNADGTFTHDYSWLDTDGSCAGAPCDRDGHGTHTMGTMVGSDGADNKVGVAPGASWIAANGCSTCSDVDLIEAGQWMLAPTKVDGSAADPAKRPNIINNSWGTKVPSNDPFMEDIAQAWAASGMFAIWSNGNNGPGCQTAGSPGSRAVNYAVGAYDEANRIGSYSSRGSGQDGGVKPDISAPGTNVRSALPGGTYGLRTGTSMAAPHVAGALALLWSAHPDLVGDVDATRDILDGSAVDTEDLQCGGTAADNNVYGEGRLDAVALVAAGDRGPIGTLTGTVTDRADATPVAGATVHVSGGNADKPTERDIEVDDKGHYLATLPVGDYAVTTSAFGFADTTHTVTVTEGGTTTRDVTLGALPTATLTGRVTDGSGQGWPLYARVSVAGTPIQGLHTNPRDGSFTVKLPTGSSYDVSAEAVYPGYETLTQTVEVGGDAAVNLAVPVEQKPCIAPGYHQQQPRIAVVSNDPGFEFKTFFEGYGLDVTFLTTSQLSQVEGYDLVLWTSNYSLPQTAAFQDLLARTDASRTGIVFADFAFGLGNGIASLSAATGNPVSVGRRNTSGSGTFYEVMSEHPILDGFGVGNRIGHLGGAQTAWFTGYEGENRVVIAGAGDQTRGVSGPGVAVQQRPGNRHVLLSMHARGAGAWLPDSEGIFWNSLAWANTKGAPFACVPDEGGALLVGEVSDANTGAGVTGAEVTVGDTRTKTTATPDDAGVGDGFYVMDVPKAGTQAVSFAAAKYETRTQSVALDGFTVVDAALAAGQLSVTPTDIRVSQELGSGTQDRTVTVTNTGTAPVDLRFGERDRGFLLQQADGTTRTRESIATAAGAKVQRLDVPVSVGASGPAANVQPTLAPHAAPWLDIADHPGAVMDNAVVRLDGRIYSIGGYGPAGHLASVAVYDPVTMAWSQAAALPAARSGMTAGVIDGRIVATGGWDSTDTPRGDTWTYDPARNAWSVGATNPVARAGAAPATLNGTLFAIGGCTTANCAPMSAAVTAYDPASDRWERLADYPKALSYLACGAIDWAVHCSGGTDAQPTAATYAYDPAANTWTAKADAPVTVWGSSFSVANDRLVLVGGVQGGQITNQAHGYDPVADSWTAMPSANDPRYRGGAACGFYKIGGSIQGYTPDPASEMLPGHDGCESSSSDVAWLSADTTSATLAVGESKVVTVTSDATVDQPGTYTAGLAIQESTPYASPAVEVTMVVTPPRSWGKVTGIVSGAACDGTSSPLGGATVQLSSRVTGRTFSTAPDGTFAHWLDKQGNANLTVTAAKAGYAIESTQVKVSAGATTEARLDLDKVGC